jgi:DNA-binding IclR family transcriptional regulator
MDVNDTMALAETNNVAVADSQALRRGLDLIEVASNEALTLSELASHLDIAKSTTARLLRTLIDRGYLALNSRSRYRPGPKLLHLGAKARAQLAVVQIARLHVEELGKATGDTVHVAVHAEGSALYLDEVPGQRRITIVGGIGDRHPLTSTAIGRALILDDGSASWRARLADDQKIGAGLMNSDAWMERMAAYAITGSTFELEENADRVRSVASPIRDATGHIVAAISVSSAAQYMGDDRLTALADNVRDAAKAISRDLGYEPRRTRVAT